MENINIDIHGETRRKPRRHEVFEAIKVHAKDLDLTLDLSQTVYFESYSEELQASTITYNDGKNGEQVFVMEWIEE